jgi:hypothetical protein
MEIKERWWRMYVGAQEMRRRDRERNICIEN